MKIDLRSDTVTRPTKGMLEAMCSAPLGDDVLDGDPTSLALEKKLAQLFGMEAGLFCPSGTMCNQLAVQVHCGRTDQILCHEHAHVYQYETGGYAYNAGVSIKTIRNEHGQLRAEDIVSAINPTYDWLENTRLVFVENSCNKSGGIIHSLDNLKDISKVCAQHGLLLHLDGARLFNAMLAGDYTPKDLTGLFDSISICLSKGLGAPVGSVLLGSETFIKTAKRLRKVMGGGMRQSGVLAAAGIYALDHHLDDLKIDHERAKILGLKMSSCSFVEKVLPVQTNIMICLIKDNYDVNKMLAFLEESGILCIGMGGKSIRMVMHRDVTAEMFEIVLEKLESLD